MIHLRIDQRSAAWKLARYGIPTASRASDLITPAKWEPTKGEKREKFLADLLAERIALAETAHLDNEAERVAVITHTLSVRPPTEAMLWGIENEPRAVSAYEFIQNVDTELVGLMLNDERTAGASLDRKIIGEPRGVEIKCPFSLSVYVGYVWSKGVDQAYLPQLMWQMMISGYESIDIYPWYPGRNESKPVRVERDEAKIAALLVQQQEFSAELDKRWNEWVARWPNEG